MKVTIPALKPRAKQLNALLVSKRCERHADPRRPSRSEVKQQTQRAIREFI